MLELRLDPSEEPAILMFGFGENGHITHVMSRIVIVDDCPEGSYAVDMSSLGYELSGNRSTHAISIQHALEISIAATARWLAHQLLVDPSQPKDRESRGVFLWHPDAMLDHPNKGENRYFCKMTVNQPTWHYPLRRKAPSFRAGI